MGRRKLTNEERLNRKVVTLMELFRIAPENGNRRVSGVIFHPEDFKYYKKRIQKYDDFQKRIAELDPVKDYSEINNLGSNREVIYKEFEELVINKLKYKPEEEEEL